jgi:hypothetical protein
MFQQRNGSKYENPSKFGDWTKYIIQENPENSHLNCITLRNPIKETFWGMIW